MMCVGLIVLASFIGGMSALVALFLGLPAPIVIMVYTAAGLATAIGVITAAFVAERICRNGVDATQPDGPFSTTVPTNPAGSGQPGNPQTDFVHLAG